MCRTSCPRKVAVNHKNRVCQSLFTPLMFISCKSVSLVKGVSRLSCLNTEFFSRNELQLFFLAFPWSSQLFSVESLTEMSVSSMSSAGAAVASAVPSARPRHQKSMSASGHPLKVTLPTIKDGAEAYRPR